MSINVIKMGDLSRLKKTEEFSCKECGCVFTADREDYSYQFSQRESTGWLETKCPCCDNFVTKKC